MPFNGGHPRYALVALIAATLAGCGGQVREVESSAPEMEGYRHVEDMYVVDCLLPGEVRQMGKTTYLSPRKPVKTTARDCRIRGGEYVAYSRADQNSALRVWRGRAEEGDPEAQVIVGEIFEKGMGVEPDYQKAVEWYRKAAEQGNERARTNLGYMYEQGLGVEQDLVTAMEWYRKASGDTQGELMLASKAQEKIEKLRTELEAERKQAQSQQRALKEQIEQLRERLENQQGSREDQSEQIQALESLLEETNERLAKKTERLDQLRNVDTESSTITRGGAPEGPISMRDHNFGRYHALVVGLERYEHWDNLASPHEDAREIASLLSENYGFSTTVILDASAQDILSTLNDLREEIGKNDNVLIYFAGHGQLRKAVAEESQHGYWLPVNAQRDRTTFWLPNSQINEQLALLPARSVLVIADSCYAGAMSTDPASMLLGDGGELSDRLIELGLERRARYILSSGGLHPVLDQGEGEHSLFANAMIDVLKNDHEILREQDLFRKISDRVAERAERLGFEQRPELRPIRAAGHNPGGSFFFVKRQDATSESDVVSFVGHDN
jgi:uncharacterized caspase-like protein